MGNLEEEKVVGLWGGAGLGAVSKSKTPRVIAGDIGIMGMFTCNLHRMDFFFNI